MRPVTRRTAPFGFSMMLVVHKQRMSAGVSLLTQIYLPLGYQSYINAHGVFKLISRDTGREPDVILTEERLIAVRGVESIEHRRPGTVAVFRERSIGLRRGEGQSPPAVLLRATSYDAQPQRDQATPRSSSRRFLALESPAQRRFHDHP